MFAFDPPPKLDTGCSLRRTDGALAAAATGLDQARRMSKRTFLGTLFTFFFVLQHLCVRCAINSFLFRGAMGCLMLPIP